MKRKHQRLAMLGALAKQRRREADAVSRLAELLTALEQGKTADIKPFVTLAESVLAAAEQSAILRFVHAEAREPARFVACHSLNVARIVARAVRHDIELRVRPLEPVLAALLHDAGMLRIRGGHR